jgi:solute carrier family 25 (mitochondrial uncoupling protein), member 27
MAAATSPSTLQPPPVALQRNQNLFDRLVLSALAAALAESATYPLDFLKTRQQLANATVGESRSMATLATTALRREGVFALYAGVAPAITRHVLYTPVRVATFEGLKCRATSPVGGGGGDASLPVLLASGLAAGAAGQLVANPADLIKIRLQADGQRCTPRYDGSMRAAAVEIFKHGGMGGMWRGAAPSVTRAALVNLGELATYSVAKSTIVRRGWLGSDEESWVTHAASAGCSGLVAALVSTPADVVKSRWMAQSADGGVAKYRGVVHCAVLTWQQEGLRGMYGGLAPTWCRLAPFQLLFWLSYEKLRLLLGMSSF